MPCSPIRMRSWLARLAARYDLTEADLLAWLNGDQAVDVWRMRRLDWQGESALDRRLAIAADLEIGRIEALRVPPPVAAAAETWARRFTTWCPECIGEDIARHGETSARGVWKLGFAATCAVHGALLTDQCGFCAARQCAFGPVHGRLRLLCGSCRQLADLAVLAPSSLVLDGRPGPLGMPRNAVAARVVATMQADLWSLLTASPGVAGGPWVVDLGVVDLAADLGAVVWELSAALLRPAWLPAGSLGRLEDLEGDLSTVSVDVAFDVLGLVTAALSQVCARVPSGVARAQPGIGGLEAVPVDFGSLVSGLSGHALTMIERSACGWPSAVAEATCQAVAMARARHGREDQAVAQQRHPVRLSGTSTQMQARAVRRIARRLRRAALARRGGAAGRGAAATSGGDRAQACRD
jgi:hypothetical protein